MSKQYYESMFPSSWRRSEPVESMGPIYAGKLEEVTRKIQEASQRKQQNLDDEMRFVIPTKKTSLLKL